MAAEPLLLPELVERLSDCVIALRRPILGAAQGAHRSRARGAAVEFADHRPYAPGDPMHRIDWKAYARSDRYLIRRHEEENRLDARILVDCSASLAYRERGTVDKALYAKRIAAAMAWLLVHQQDRVGLTRFTDRLHGEGPITGSLASLQRQLADLAAHAPAGDGDIAEALQAQAARGWRRGLVVVISDFLDEPARLRAPMRQLQGQGHELWFVHVLDRAEVLLPHGGVASVSALEGGGKLVVELDAVRERYRQAVEDHVTTLRHCCGEVGGRHHLAFTDVELEATVRSIAR